MNKSLWLVNSTVKYKIQNNTRKSLLDKKTPDSLSNFRKYELVTKRQYNHVLLSVYIFTFRAQ